MAEIRFNTAFLSTDSVRRAKHGQIWQDEELCHLEKLFLCGTPLSAMCEALQRSAQGVVAKLRSQRFIWPDSDGYHYLTDEAKIQSTKPITESTIEEEPIVTINVPVIETKTFIHGLDASTMSDEDIFVIIAKLEERWRKYDVITAKPKKMVIVMDTIRADIVALTVYVDGRP